jgi:hypothetical protein
LSHACSPGDGQQSVWSRAATRGVSTPLSHQFSLSRSLPPWRRHVVGPRPRSVCNAPDAGREHRAQPRDGQDVPPRPGLLDGELHPHRLYQRGRRARQPGAHLRGVCERASRAVRKFLLWYRPGLLPVPVSGGYKGLYRALNARFSPAKAGFHCRPKPFYCRPRSAAQLLPISPGAKPWWKHQRECVKATKGTACNHDFEVLNNPVPPPSGVRRGGAPPQPRQRAQVRESVPRHQRQECAPRHTSQKHSSKTPEAYRLTRTRTTCPCSAAQCSLGFPD